MTESTDGLIWAYVLDKHGGGRQGDWDAVREWDRTDGVMWVHLDRTHARVRPWLEQESGLGPYLCNALLADETRPRCFVRDDSLLTVLRGVNLNPGADPEDMISLRMWFDGRRILTLRSDRVLTIQDMKDALDSGKGPRSPAEFLIRVAHRLIERMAPVLNELHERLDSLEEAVVNPDEEPESRTLGNLRREAAIIRRHLYPQQSVLEELSTTEVPWLSPKHHASLHESANLVTRYVEDLDAIRERGAVLHEELHAQQQERMNRNMYALSIIAAIFLPLSFLTGLLGINVAGIPAADNPAAFAIVSGGLVFIAGALFLFFRRLRWL